MRARDWCLTPAAGTNPFKERDRLWFVVDPKSKLVGCQAFNKLPLLIKDHDVGLHQLGINSEHVIGLIGWLEPVGSLGSARDRPEQEQNKNSGEGLVHRCAEQHAEGGFRPKTLEQI